MKKIVTALVASAVLSSPCFAKGDLEEFSVCGYHDFYHLATGAPAVSITSLTGDEKVVVTQSSTTSFYIKDAPACVRNGGYAHVRYTLNSDKSSYCDVAVHDAENFIHPEISAKCAGKLSYTGFSWDGIGTNSYTLKLASSTS